jgi:hypothetical protein
MGIVGDFMYSLIDPRIDFESREWKVCHLSIKDV